MENTNHSTNSPIIDEVVVQSQKKNKGPVIASVLIALFLVITIIFIIPLPKLDNVTLELGDEVCTEPSNYLRGASFWTDYADFDVANVDNLTPGTYPISVSVTPFTYGFTITVVDTTAPVITLAQTDDCLAINKTFHIEDFVSETSDLSNTQKTLFSIDGTTSDELSFSDAGMHEFDIICSDASGNTSTETISIEFDKAPQYLLLSDKYIKTGDAFDPLKYAFAYDENDGNITNNISVDTSNLDSNKTGLYEITYTVKNQKGVRAEETINVYVGDSTDYNITVADDEIETLKSYNYFNYDPINPGNYTKAKSIVAPTSVNISTLNYKTSSGSKATASGGIFKITPKYTYLLTNRHVINSLSGRKMEIMIFDKTVIPLGEIKTVTSAKSDIGIIRFSTSAIPDEKLLELKEYNYDKTVLSNLSKDTKVFSLTNKFKQGDDISQTGTIIDPSITSLFNYFYFDAPKIQTSVPARTGQSGSPLFDYNGYLITVISSTYVNSDGTTVYAYEHLEEVEELMKEIDK